MLFTYFTGLVVDGYCSAIISVFKPSPSYIIFHQFQGRRGKRYKISHKNIKHSNQTHALEIVPLKKS